jgi:NAD(P)-dependent dehydrogenase (short-subunit alcohol dehydrogenase family)
MKKIAIVTGACSAMGVSVCDQLVLAGWNLIKWCRCNGVDITKPETLPSVKEVSAVVHISESGMPGLENVWNSTKDELRESRGNFIGFSSVHHLNNFDSYAASKRQQEWMLKEYAKDGLVRVNCLRLGHILGTKTWPKEDASRISEIPLVRFGTTHEVAEAVMFIIYTRWMTGSVLTLDGGMSLKM